MSIFDVRQSQKPLFVTKAASGGPFGRHIVRTSEGRVLHMDPNRRIVHMLDLRGLKTVNEFLLGPLCGDGVPHDIAPLNRYNFSVSVGGEHAGVYTVHSCVSADV